MVNQKLISNIDYKEPLQDALFIGTETDRSILNLLEDCFLLWAKKLGTLEMVFPPIISIEDLESINYFQDHPTQAVFLSALSPNINTLEGSYENKAEPLGYALNPAACYHVYLSQRNQEINQMVRISTQTECFRNQPPYASSSRMFRFQQRKFAFIGESQEVRTILKQTEALVHELSGALELGLSEKTSQAPNYTNDPKLEKIKALFLADKEFTYGSFSALCHTNFHRNYFCKRLNIKSSNGQYAFAGCLGVIPEYWLLSLKHKHKNDTNLILKLLKHYLN
jgi:hypothetical protein